MLVEQGYEYVSIHSEDALIDNLRRQLERLNQYSFTGKEWDSFWAGSGLCEYVQIFVISNGTNTKYYSNTTRFSHIKENETTSRKRNKKTSNSFEFTSYWADGNKPHNS